MGNMDEHKSKGYKNRFVINNKNKIFVQTYMEVKPESKTNAGLQVLKHLSHRTPWKLGWGLGTVNYWKSWRQEDISTLQNAASSHGEERIEEKIKNR